MLFVRPKLGKGCDANQCILHQWPLDKRPPYYASQGERFSDILQMLLKMRGLPPKTAIRPDTGILRAADGSDENAMRWFDSVNITRKLEEIKMLHCP